ncbi:myelin protein zero-like protein 2b [Nematolebias whitei]|uniref:myelin protein zero-like protein 2b n=1 Tax=Nematolebias whitei TaxID=451745 RepID=UPI001896C014|nr:myelin protein zero-like protein 2b [Nematolebias whitei]
MFFHKCNRTWQLVLLAGLVLPGIRQVCGIEIFTPSEVEAVNGTSVKLKCTFSSTHSVSLQSVTVSWSFRPLTGGTDESVFYYQETAYPPEDGRFKGHAVWSGDVTRKDASITLQEVLPTFNGTYICQVKNRPDVHGSNGETVLKVVDKASMSEITMLATAVGGACGVVLVLLGIFVAVRVCRRKHSENDFEMQTETTYEKKGPTVCSPAEAAHLMVVAKKKKEESSEDESDLSSDDDEEGCLDDDDYDDN